MGQFCFVPKTGGTGMECSEACVFLAFRRDKIISS